MLTIPVVRDDIASCIYKRTDVSSDPVASIIYRWSRGIGRKDDTWVYFYQKTGIFYNTLARPSELVQYKSPTLADSYQRSQPPTSN